MASKTKISEFLERDFPQCKCKVEAVGNGTATVRHPVGSDELRPGGTGPVLMAVADVGLYVAILGVIGMVPLTVTTSFNINFLRKPTAANDIIAVCKLLKVGQSLVVGEATLYSEGSDNAVAHAVGTYSIPPRKAL